MDCVDDSPRKIEHDSKITLYVDLSDHMSRAVEDDDLHDGCKKPLTSSDVTRREENRDLSSKLSPIDVSAPTMVAAAPKVIRRAVLKDNGGLVPLCPGTTQIRGMKRRTVFPKDFKPHRRKRARIGSIYQLSKETRIPYSSSPEEGRSSTTSLPLMATDPSVQCERSKNGKGDGFILKERRDVEKDATTRSDHLHGEELAGGGCCILLGGIALKIKDHEPGREEQRTSDTTEREEDIIRLDPGEPSVHSEDQLYSTKEVWKEKVCDDEYAEMITKSHYQRGTSPVIRKDRKSGPSCSHPGSVRVEKITVKTRCGFAATLSQADGLPLQEEQSNQCLEHGGEDSAAATVGNRGPNCYAVKHNHLVTSDTNLPEADFGGYDNRDEIGHDTKVLCRLEGKPRVKYPRSGHSAISKRCKISVRGPAKHVSNFKKMEPSDHVSAFQAKLSTRSPAGIVGSRLGERTASNHESRQHQRTIHNVGISETHYTVQSIQKCLNGPGVSISAFGNATATSSPQLSEDVCEEITVAHCDGTSRHVSDLVSDGRDAGGTSENSSIRSLLPQQNSTRLFVRPMTTSEVSQGLRVTGLQHHCSTLGECSEACSACVPANYEVAGIRMHRRSWDALKAAQILSKKRISPKINRTIGKRLPLITSRFKNCSDVVQRRIPESSFEISPPRQVSVGATTNKSHVTKKCWQKWGPRKIGHETSCTRVSSRLAEKLVQRIDSSCVTVRPIKCVYSSSINTNSLCGMRAIAPPKGKLRRGLNKVEKEKLKENSTSHTFKFKPLSESSGLLGEFNPGIISRVRNSRQIQATLGTLIASVLTPTVSKPDKRAQGPNVPLVAAGGKYHISQEASLKQEEDLLSHTEPPRAEAVEPNIGAVACVTKFFDDSNPEPGAMETKCTQNNKSVHARPVSSDGYLGEDIEHQTYFMPEFPAAAELAGRWLELLTLDVRGRLSALRRSRRRVRSTLLSEFLDPERGTSMTCSVTTDQFPNQHMDRWRSLFTNMDAVLCLEAVKLEKWLWQIQQTQSLFEGPGKENCLPC